MILCQDFCLDILSELYGDATRLQLMYECDQLRWREHLLPKESLIFYTTFSKLGEHYFYNYCDSPQNMIDFNPGNGGSGQIDENERPKFYDKKAKKINSYWRIPSNLEILKIENPFLDI